jgi:hypothetical protein
MGNLILQISVTEEKNSIIFYDCTGPHSYDNKNGYGHPNPKIEDVVEAYLEVKRPGWVEGQEPIKIVLYPSVPNLTGFGFELTPSMLGSSNNDVESGQYKFKYVVVTVDKNGLRLTHTAYVTLFCMNAVTCCIDKRIKEIRAGGHNDPKQQLIIELSNLLEAVKYQIDCENFGIANEDVEYLKSQCKCCGCS